MENLPEGARRIRYASNVWKFYIYKSIWGFAGGMILPIIVLFFLEKGLSLGEFTYLMGVMNLSIFFFEVPMGIVADKFSLRWSVFFGMVATCTTLSIWILSNELPALFLSMVLFGIGESLFSGADSALLFESLKADGREKEHPPIVGNAISMSLGMMVLGTLCCGLFIRLGGLTLAMWATFWIGLLNVLNTATFSEPPRENAQEDASFWGKVRQYNSHMLESLRIVGRSWELIILSLYNFVIMRAVFTANRPFAQPYLKGFAFSNEQISYCYTAFSSVSAAFAKLSHRIGSWMGSSDRASLALVAVLTLLSLVGMVNAWTGSLVVISLIGLHLAQGLFMPAIDSSLNRRIPSEQRASCLSITKMGNNFLGIFLAPLFGYLADTRSLAFSLEVFGWTFDCLLLLMVSLGWVILRPREAAGSG